MVIADEINSANNTGDNSNWFSGVDMGLVGVGKTVPKTIDNPIK